MKMRCISLVLCMICMCCSTYGEEETKVGFFKVEECDANNDQCFTQLKIAEVSPDPVILSRGNVNVTLGLSILKDIPGDGVLHMKYYKMTNVLGVNVDVPIPCSVLHCQLSICEFMKIYKPQIEPFWAGNTYDKCVLGYGRILGGNKVTVDIPDLGEASKWFVTGKYRTEVFATPTKSAEDTPLFCYKIFYELTS